MNWAVSSTGPIESGTDKAKYDKFCEQERQNLYVTVVTV